MSTGELREHTFDGIQEFDNRLPNWWLWTFYAACIFSVLYWIHYHSLGTGDLPEEAYLAQQQEAARKLEERMAGIEITDDMLRELAANPAFVAKGREIFTNPSLCAQCHGEQGNGIVNGKPGVGPNLTDKFWLNGGSPTEIYNTILEGGRPNKGMQAWKVNGPTFVQRATAYVLSLRNTNVEGKPPEEDAVAYEGN